MGQLTVRNVDDRLIKALKQRAASHGRSAEAEHRDILRHALSELDEPGKSVPERAREMRQRFRSSIDTTELIRADRERDHTS